MTVRADSYCGLYCGACFVVQAERDEKQEELIKAFKERVEFKPDEIKCTGCKGTGYVFKGCQECKIRTCARERKVEFCYECAEFPCQKVTSFQNGGLAHTYVAVHNLAEIKKMGAKAWLAQQKTRWSCSKCGKPSSWIEEKCAKCGSPLYNSAKEKNDLKRKKK